MRKIDEKTGQYLPYPQWNDCPICKRHWCPTPLRQPREGAAVYTADGDYEPSCGCFKEVGKLPCERCGMEHEKNCEKGGKDELVSQ